MNDWNTLLICQKSAYSSNPDFSFNLNFYLCRFQPQKVHLKHGSVMVAALAVFSSSSILSTSLLFTVKVLPPVDYIFCCSTAGIQRRGAINFMVPSSCSPQLAARCWLRAGYFPPIFYSRLTKENSECNVPFLYSDKYNRKH